jgi:uncharacterized membrane protein YeaQ/YmgE (transglycosylase-associated protein family)
MGASPKRHLRGNLCLLTLAIRGRSPGLVEKLSNFFGIPRLPAGVTLCYGLAVTLSPPAERDVITTTRCNNTSTFFVMIHILWYIIVGFIVGWIAKAIMHVHLGLVATCLLGIIGSIVGGLIARLWSRPADGAPFHPAGFIMSIIGAIVLVFLVRLVTG